MFVNELMNENNTWKKNETFNFKFFLIHTNVTEI